MLRMHFSMEKEIVSVCYIKRTQNYLQPDYIYIFRKHDVCVYIFLFFSSSPPSLPDEQTSGFMTTYLIPLTYRRLPVFALKRRKLLPRTLVPHRCRRC